MDPRTIIEKIDAADDAGHSALERELYRRLIESGGEKDATHILYAGLLTKFSLLAEAHASLDRAEALARKRAWPYLWRARGQVHEAAGDFPGAREAYGRAAEFAPEDATSFIYLGLLLARLGEYGESEAALRRATECPEGCLDEAHFNLAGAMIRRRDYAAAERHLEKALEIDPAYKIAALRLADVRLVRELLERPEAEANADADT